MASTSTSLSQAVQEDVVSFDIPLYGVTNLPKCVDVTALPEMDISDDITILLIDNSTKSIINVSLESFLNYITQLV